MPAAKSSRFIFETAQEADAPELLAILEDAAFKGNISLLYTRRPDAYRSLMQEAKDVRVLLARDTTCGKIAGFGACALHELFVNGRPRTVAYLFSLRIARNYRKKAPLLHRAYRALYEHNRAERIACYLTTILEDNHDAQKLLEKPRSFMPTYKPLGAYEVFALRCRNTRRSKRVRDNSFIFRQANLGDLENLTDFLRREGRDYQFFPVAHAADLQNGQFYGLSIKDFYLLHSEGGDIFAAGAPWDQRQYKQYIVQGYGAPLKYLRPLSRLLPLFGYPSLPAPGETLAFFTLSFWAVKDNDTDLFGRFLDEIMSVSGQFPFFLIGLHERHPLHPMLQRRRHISYRSKVYKVSRKDSPEEALERAYVPYLECGLL